MFIGFSLIMAVVIVGCVSYHRAAVFSLGMIALVAIIVCAVEFPAVLAAIALPFCIYGAITTPRQP